MNVIWFIAYIGIAVILAIAIKAVLDHFGIPVPVIVWILLGCMVAVALLLWAARFLSGVAM